MHIMPQQRETTTDRLANVIQVIQLGRKTGLLTVERGEGTNFEEGTMTFAQGQLTQAQAGQRSGINAFNWLNTWGACRFAFVPADTGKQVRIPPTTSLHNTGIRPPLRRQETDSLERLPKAHPFDTPPGSFPSNTGSFPTHTTNTGGLPPVHNSGIFNRINPTQPPRAPRMVRMYDDGLYRIEQSGLSRAHRRLFLLIDGNRSPLELARLMGRSFEEVVQLLADLEIAGIIQQ